MTRSRLQLYTGSQCGLCDSAKDVIYATLSAESYDLTIVDVTDNLDAKKTYGLRIPVLRNINTHQELEWPFNSEELADFVVQGDT